MNIYARLARKLVPYLLPYFEAFIVSVIKQTLDERAAEPPKKKRFIGE